MSHPVIDCTALREEYSPAAYTDAPVPDYVSGQCEWSWGEVLATLWAQLRDFLAEGVNALPLWFLASLPLLLLVSVAVWFWWLVR